MHYRTNPRRKRSQIGALSAANCRLTPNSIELKISKGTEEATDSITNKNGHTSNGNGTEKVGRRSKVEKDVLSKEIQVIQSKKGMIADISRTFSTALTHKTNLIRRTGGLGGFKDRTRIGAH